MTELCGQAAGRLTDTMWMVTASGCRGTANKSGYKGSEVSAEIDLRDLYVMQ